MGLRRDDNECEVAGSDLRRDQIAHRRHMRFVGDQFLAEHAGFLARGLGREAAQQDQ